MKKTILRMISIMLCLMMIFSANTVVFAEDNGIVANIAEKTYTSLEDAVEAANDGETITITSDIVLTSTLMIKDKTITLTSSGEYSIQRSNDFNNDSLIKVENTGTLTLENITIDGKGISTSSNMLQIEGTLNLKDGAMIQNHKATETDSMEHAAIYVLTGTLNMSGGKICHNVGSSFGGGITLRSYASMIFTGGEISDNTASNGGGIYIYEHSTLEMNGGTVTQNQASSFSGGIYVGADAKATIKAGYITYNSQKSISWGGAGIYVNGNEYDSHKQPGELYIYNVEITGNSTTNEDYKDRFDSVISSCQTGHVDINITDGAVIHDNGASNTVIIYQDNNSGTFTLSPIMLGGAAYHWTDKEGRSLGLDEIVWTGDTTGYKYAKTDVSTETNTISGLDRVKTYIIGNTSEVLGSAIATNGLVYIGKSDGDVTLNIEKVWDESVLQEDREESIVIDIYATDGNGETTKIGFVTLSDDNDWKAIVSNLPKLDSDGKEYTYTVSEESTKYYSEVISEKQADEDDDPLTEKYNITVTNKAAGDLTVSKTVSGDAADIHKEFTFIVTLDDDSINGTYGDMTFVKGIAKMTLKHGESITATGLPAGVAYFVEENNIEDYKVTSEGERGIIVAYGKEQAVASFNNYKDKTTVVPEEPTQPQEPTTPDEVTQPDPSVDQPVISTPVENTQPNTGDSYYIGYCVFAMFISGVGLLILNKKNQYKNK